MVLTIHLIKEIIPLYWGKFTHNSFANDFIEISKMIIFKVNFLNSLYTFLKVLIELSLNIC